MLGKRSEETFLSDHTTPNAKVFGFIRRYGYDKLRSTMAQGAKGWTITGPRGDSSRRAISIRASPREEAGQLRSKGNSASAWTKRTLDPRFDVDISVPRMIIFSIHRDLHRGR
jgi:hypothetical protein